MEMRRKLCGTFDTTTKTWRLRTKKVQISVRQLEKRYGVEIGPTERESLPYWRRYLQDLEDQHRISMRKASPLKERIRSIEAMIARCKREGLPYSELERELEDAIATSPMDHEAADLPVLHPRAVDAAKILGLDADPIAIGLMNNLVPTVTKPQDNIGHEAKVFLQRYKGKAASQHKQAVNLLLSITGDVPIHAVNVHHYRRFRESIIGNERWNETTQCNILKIGKLFLKRIEHDHDVSYSFIRNPAYNLQQPDGSKVQYTMEEVATALKHAKGDIRLALLLGLNCGMGWSDMRTLTCDKVKDGHVHAKRQKLKHKNSVTCCWLLWEETKRLLYFDMKVGRTEDQFAVWRKQHGLPIHKALRKTMAQIIHDNVGETESRLYRGENVGGTHGKNYIKAYSPEQVAKLDAALLKAGALIGVC